MSAEVHDGMRLATEDEKASDEYDGVDVGDDTEM